MGTEPPNTRSAAKEELIKELAALIRSIESKFQPVKRIRALIYPAPCVDENIAI
jgi:hypothetical protein